MLSFLTQRDGYQTFIRKAEIKNGSKAAMKPLERASTECA
jgi:hypothetical protein